MWNGAVTSTLIRKTGRHEFITGAEAAGTAYEGAGNEPGKRHWFGLFAIIRRGAWTLPAAGLPLGAPWIKPYFASSADAAVETASWPPFRANDLDTWARIATSDSYQLFSLTQVLGTPARIRVVMSMRLHRLLGRSEGRRK